MTDTNKPEPPSTAAVIVSSEQSGHFQSVIGTDKIVLSQPGPQEPEVEELSKLAAKEISGIVLSRLNVEGFNQRVQFIFTKDIARIIASTYAALKPEPADPSRDQRMWEQGMRDGLLAASIYVGEHDNLGDIAKIEILQLKVTYPGAETTDNARTALTDNAKK